MMIEHLPMVRVAIDSSMTMLIWLVQLIIYPAFQSLEKERFTDWHHNYMRTISFIVIPLMCLQAAVIGFQCLEVPSIGNLLSAAFILIAWGTTFLCSVPCHKKLQVSGKEPDTISRLINTNWARTAAWTAALISGVL